MYTFTTFKLSSHIAIVVMQALKILLLDWGERKAFMNDLAAAGAVCCLFKRLHGDMVATADTRRLWLTVNGNFCLRGI